MGAWGPGSSEIATRLAGGKLTLVDERTEHLRGSAYTVALYTVSHVSLWRERVLVIWLARNVQIVSVIWGRIGQVYLVDDGRILRSSTASFSSPSYKISCDDAEGATHAAEDGACPGLPPQGEAVCRAAAGAASGAVAAGCAIYHLFTSSEHPVFYIEMNNVTCYGSGPTTCLWSGIVHTGATIGGSTVMDTCYEPTGFNESPLVGGGGYCLQHFVNLTPGGLNDAGPGDYSFGFADSKNAATGARDLQIYTGYGTPNSQQEGTKCDMTQSTSNPTFDSCTTVAEDWGFPLHPAG